MRFRSAKEGDGGTSSMKIRRLCTIHRNQQQQQLIDAIQLQTFCGCCFLLSCRFGHYFLPFAERGVCVARVQSCDNCVHVRNSLAIPN